jgi:hypothetical protein
LPASGPTGSDSENDWQDPANLLFLNTLEHIDSRVRQELTLTLLKQYQYSYWKDCLLKGKQGRARRVVRHETSVTE